MLAVWLGGASEWSAVAAALVLLFPAVVLLFSDAAAAAAAAVLRDCNPAVLQLSCDPRG